MGMLDRIFSLVRVNRKLVLGKNATLAVTNANGAETTVNILELAALDNIGAADLAKIDGITNGTAAAGKALVADSNIDVSGMRHVGMTGTATVGAIAGADAALDVTGLGAAQGGAITVTGGTSSTATNAGGAVIYKGGAGNTSGAGGAATLQGGVPGVTGVGGAAEALGGIGGATSGKGGASKLTGGAGTAGNGAGGSTIITPGAAHGSGLAGGNFLRSAGGLHFRQQTAATAKADGPETITAAQMINGIVVFTVTTGRTLTTPTGAAILAGCPTDIAAGDSFDLTVITVGTGADDIATLTAGDADVTLVGNVTVGPDSATNNGYGTWRFRYTGANAFVGYRIG
jgi:hypothetical protein